MSVTQYLSTARIATQQTPRNKRGALDQLATLLADGDDQLEAESVATALINRERLGSTAMGHGVAIPHGRMEGLPEPVAAFMQLDGKLDFRENQDGGNQPVDLIAGLIVPSEATSEHLQLLASLAEMFVDESFCQKLREIDDADALLEAMQSFQP